MKTYTYCIKSLLIVLTLSSCKNGNNSTDESYRTENYVVFAKAYGYVKYFHPSDEASQIDWNKFSIYGVSQIGKCKTKSDIIKTLNNLFEPIGPSIKFASDTLAFETNLNQYIPDKSETYKLTYWQHQGVSINMDRKDQTYESRRINREDRPRENQLFDDKLEFGESIIKEIGDGMYCQIPIVLYCDGNSTFPEGNLNRLIKLNESLSKINTSEINDVFLRIGNVINVYNVFQHFYPYFDVVDVNWSNELRKSIQKSYSDKTLFDHQITLEKFTAPLNDGHISVVNDLNKNYFVPPISWEWIENKLVITHLYNNNYDIKVGDIVTHINNSVASEYFDEINSRISAGTIGWLNYRANILSLQGEEGSKMIVKIGNRSIELQRSVNLRKDWKKIRKKKEEYLEIEEGIWYVNLSAIDIYTFNELLPKFKKSKSIIFDLRGYTKVHSAILSHLLPIDDTTKAWLHTPIIVYPDHNRKNGYLNHNWLGKVKAYEPYLGSKKITFIINGEAISYAESIMGYIEGYNLATIIGQPTAGTNGAANIFSLPGGYRMSWTGMKVTKHDGSQHHGVGVLPDIYVDKTIQGIKDGRDEYLEKALEESKMTEVL